MWVSSKKSKSRVSLEIRGPMTLWMNLGDDGAVFFVKDSPLHGNGLFLTQDCPRGTIVTYYDGEQIGWREAKQRQDRSYLRSVAFGHLVIDGLREPTLHRGAGSFANHSSGANNAIFWVRDDNVWIKLRQNAKKGDEVLVNYGRGYWRGRADRIL